MADLVVTELTFAIVSEDTVTSGSSFGPASPGSARARRQGGGTRDLRVVHGTIALPNSASTYATVGFPISGVTQSSTVGTSGGPIGSVVAGNGLACPGLACFQELVELTIDGQGSTKNLTAQFVRGTAGTTPHKIKLFTDNAAAAAVPLSEVPNGTAANSATIFPDAPATWRVTAYGF